MYTNPSERMLGSFKGFRQNNAGYKNIMGKEFTLLNKLIVVLATLLYTYALADKLLKLKNQGDKEKLMCSDCINI